MIEITCVLMLCLFILLIALAIFCKATNDYFDEKSKIEAQKVDIVCDALKKINNPYRYLARFESLRWVFREVSELEDGYLKSGSVKL